MPDSSLDDFEFCNASIVTLIVDESKDEDGSPTLNQNTTGSEHMANMASTPAKVKRFFVHEKLLCDVSPVLQAAFQGHFAEAENKSMTIKDLDARMVNVLLRWLYSGKRLPEKPNTMAAEQVWYLNMARLAVLADIYQIEGLGEDIIDVLVTGSFVKPPQWPVIDFIYANTPASSNLRRWLVAWATERIDCIWFCKKTTNLAPIPEYASDVAKAFGRQKSSMASKPFFNMNREERKPPSSKGQWTEYW